MYAYISISCAHISGWESRLKFLHLYKVIFILFTLYQIDAESDLESVRRRIEGVPADAAKRYIKEKFPNVVKKARYVEKGTYA